MYIVCVTVKVKPGKGEAFLEAARKNREGTRKEPGNLRFDVLKAAAPSADGEIESFFLFEVYRTPEDFAAHQQTAHYFAFRDEVAEWMAEPRQGMRYVPVHADSWE
jgi:(4S)-4-hydroxy-5-phosphonooxypentane-2,3-dione isomerase